MKTTLLNLILACAIMALSAGFAVAADQDQQRDQVKQVDKTQQTLQTKDQDKMIYGWQLMTVEERNAFRAKMQSLQTEQERLAFQQEHHILMQQRAKEQGVTLPDKPLKRNSKSNLNLNTGSGSNAGAGGGGGKGK